LCYPTANQKNTVRNPLELRTSTAFAVIPDRNAGVVVLSNLDSVAVKKLAMQILRVALDVPDSAP